MDQPKNKTIRFRGREEKVLETFRVRGRNYFGLEKLSRRGAFRVFDPHAAPGGGYRVLYCFSSENSQRQKIEILRRLGGPAANRNFPTIIEVVRSGSDLFVVVEWVWGTSLRDYLTAVRSGATPRPSVPETVRLMRGLAHGLGHYHRKTNIVHGDVSPANIIITSGTRHLVLIDFGSTWPVEQSAIRVSGDGVTPPYAAPERHAQHAAEDFRSDVFSHSAVAYEMLTMQIPYDGLGGKAGLPTIIEHAEHSFRPPSELLKNPGRLPRAALERLDRCLRVGLNLHPDSRFGTRKEWLSAWDELDGSFKPTDRLSRPARFVMRAFDSLVRLVAPREEK